MSVTRVSAILLALMTAGLIWLSLLTAPGGIEGASLPSLMMAALIVLAPLAFLLARPPSLVARFGVALLAVVPTLLLALALYEARMGLESLVFWPQGVAALAGALAILTLAEVDRSDPMPAASFPLGGALLALAVAAVAIPMSPIALPQALPLLAATPVHLALSVLGAAVLAGILIAALRRELSTPGLGFLRALIGLLPLLGFTGTVLGIMQALDGLPEVFEGGDSAGALTPLLAGLATAFQTTLIGLVASVAAGLALAVLQVALTRGR